MPQPPFDELDTNFDRGGTDAVLEQLIGQLRADKNYHGLFDALLMQARRRMGEQAVATVALESQPEPLRTQLETAYMDVCREVGALLLQEGKLREAWLYLRPAGEAAMVARALEKVQPREDNLQELIEVALHEGIAPALGLGIVLEHYGTCNAITTFEGSLVGRPLPEQQAAAALLLRRLHRELTANVRADIAQRAGREPNALSLAELVAAHEELFANHNYHIDTTHLAAIVRFARVLVDPELLSLALDLTEYGSRLSEQFQFRGDEPFGEIYVAHRWYFSALLGRQVDAAVAYFAERARTLTIDDHGPAPAEVYVDLLHRLGRHAEALEASVSLLPPTARRCGIAPSLLELSRAAGDFDRLLQVCRENGDLVGYTTGLIESQQAASAAKRPHK